MTYTDHIERHFDTTKSQSFSLQLLGPVRLVVDGQEAPFGGPKAAALLTALAVHPNQWVSLDRLTSAVWGDDAPPSARVNLRGYARQIRNRLRGARASADDRLASGRACYRLRVEPGELDADAFGELADQASAATHRRDTDRAIRLYDRALALWRGPAAANVPPVPALEPFTSALDERRLSVSEDRMEVLLSVGEEAAVISGARSLLADNPNRERAWGLLMLALYRLGDASGALNAYQQARAGLVDRLGIEPGAHLVELQRLILARDSRLGPCGQPHWPPSPDRGRQAGYERPARSRRQTIPYTSSMATGPA